MSIGTFVSIGTARPKPQPTGSRFSQVIRGGINRLGDPGRHRRSCATPASQTVILHAYLLDTYYLSRGIITNPSTRCQTPPTNGEGTTHPSNEDRLVVAAMFYLGSLAVVVLFLGV
ncbi:uncharacterized protein GGS25DRAFT_275070 [Hypoxylon fragiforme]|uniref:uncharacterized protein n=1 Tax=Hypoxylon fragiforme TaxID=63214 RepID=UPI0020C6B4F3|nr:uncharacterized protein GGS25DRAFT_275070 [Hypoxylon fragiforme]KAI2608415.1 hypothetical protein GGS25DRAFT_275070 [Hypoxylon fragiforme]